MSIARRMRGNEGYERRFGTITKMTVKIFPFVPEKF